ncbi:MAG: translation elongation factor 2 (EF-2/EF-G) [Acidobacteria bacterium OLB17]|nr:MAG: translation elongation factor 2 (EF-2/EF-G) [Acidobacteria bacterium OLB17]
MKAFNTENIRNLAVIGHGDAGKTQLVASLLYVAGATPRWGKVDEGTTVTDFDEDSIERKVSLNNNFAHLEYKDTKINLIDTPGYAAFVSHARPALRVADCALVVVDGVHGIEVQTEKTWQYANEFLLPRFMVINKIDKEHADFGHALETATSSFARSIVPFSLPIGKEGDFKGVVDVVHQKAYSFDENGKAKEIPIPEDGRDVFERTRERLIEIVAESDDALMEKYFAEGTLPEEDIYPNLAKRSQAANSAPFTPFRRRIWSGFNSCSITSSNSPRTRQLTRQNTDLRTPTIRATVSPGNTAMTNLSRHMCSARSPTRSRAASTL